MVREAAGQSNRVKAYCPGHVTGIFTVEDTQPDPLLTGSRGLGFCTELGATSEIEFSPGTGIIQISINGKPSEAPVTRMALEHMLPKLSLDLEVDIQLQAPIGQGFGMSAAGTQATCLAAAVHLNLFNPHLLALRATHIAEVELGAGLGDAIAQATGGFVHRLAPGVSSRSNAIRLNAPEPEVLFCILGDELSTKSIIQDPVKKKIISQEGYKYLAEFEEGPDFDNFIKLSRKFAEGTGLLTREMSEVLSSIGENGAGSMVMLGNSIFIIGEDIASIEEELSKQHRTIITRMTDSLPKCIPIIE